MPKQLKSIDELSQMHILYVEDDEVIAEAFLIMLKRMVKRVYYCKNGKEGLETYQDEHPDIIITDIKMPVMSGLEMARAIRQKDDEVPIIIVSAYNETEFLQEAFIVGITYYLNKPVNRLVLMRTLNESAKSVVYRQHQDELIQNYEESLDALVDLIERRDRYTAGHSARVAQYCVLLAKGMGIDDKRCALLEKAARIHDIGKIEIPDSILLNPSKLNELEYAIVKEHLSSGYAVLSKTKQYHDIAEIMRHHHEHYDGSGYPQGLEGDEIPLLSHIIIIADAFDAMTSNRIYKPRKSLSEALVEIDLLSGIHFHPDIVSVAMQTLDKIEIDVDDDQMPKSPLEEKKFAYFFSDPLTGLYNEDYLHSLRTHAKSEKSLERGKGYITILDLHAFSSFNKRYGWKAGDELIKKIATFLLRRFPGVLIFRVRGVQFYLLSEDGVTLSSEELESVISDEQIRFDITEQPLDGLSSLEGHDG